MLNLACYCISRNCQGIHESGVCEQDLDLKQEFVTIRLEKVDQISSLTEITKRMSIAKKRTEAFLRFNLI